MTLLTYLRNSLRSVYYTPSDQTNNLSESEKTCKPCWYLVMIGILTGLLAGLMSVTVLEFIKNKDMMTNLEEMQLAVKHNEKIQKVLSSKRLNYIWDLCNQTTLQCSPCLPGWKEHASRCFFLSNVEKNWEDARRDCLDYKGDLAVVLNKDDQGFLTNMTFQVKKASPNGMFQSAWIGLQDMVKEGHFFWVNGDKLKPDVRFWRLGEPNNAVPAWDTDESGQDCVSILPPDEVGPKGWINSWEDIICIGKRHYICETDAMIAA